MKMLKKLLAVAFCGVMACALVGCQSQEPQQKDEEVQVSDTASLETEPFWVLVVGNDSRTGTVEINKPDYSDGTGRSDVMMLVRVDPKAYAISIISVPRDTETQFNGQKVKLNEVYHVAGIEESMKAVADLTGVAPKYYMDMSFVQFEDFVEGLGGLTANVPINMQLQDIVSGDHISLTKGEQDLNGKEALVLARSRKQYANDLDACRQIQDRAIVQSGIKQVASDPSTAASFASVLSANCSTNWDARGLSALVVDFAENADKITFVSGTGPYAGEIDAGTGLWLAYRDEATWAKVIAAAEKGEDPREIVPEPKVAAL
jgi:LCP family protein required for cell wall assembly